MLLSIPSLIAGSSAGIVPAQVFLVDENCEGTGTPANWADTGTVDWDYTANIINGAQSVHISVPSSFSRYSSFTGQTTAYLKARLRVIATDTSGSFHECIIFRDSGNALLTNCRIVRSSGSSSNVRVGTATGQSASSSTVLTANTNYYVWLTHISSGTCELAMSASNVKPSVDGSGDVFVTTTTNAGTATKCEIAALGTSSDYVFDDIQVSASPIA